MLHPDIGRPKPAAAIAAWVLAASLPLLEYLAISNSGQLYSYPGDDTGAWQFGSLIQWRHLPFRPFIASVFAVVREPFWTISMATFAAYFKRYPTEIPYWYDLLFMGHPVPRRWDLIFMVVNTAIWLAALSALYSFFRWRRVSRGLSAPPVHRFVFSVAALVLVLSVIHHVFVVLPRIR